MGEASSHNLASLIEPLQRESKSDRSEGGIVRGNFFLSKAKSLLVGKVSEKGPFLILKKVVRKKIHDREE